MKNLHPWLWPFSVLSIVLIAGLGYTVEQHEFAQLMWWFIPLFGLYLWSLRKDWTEREVFFLLGVGVLMRLTLLGSFPGLSDDIYRFVWDGRLWIAGYNPFDHLPAWYMEEGLPITGITPELYAQLNSPEYYTIYPPVAQLTFTISAWLFPNSIYGSAIVMHSFLILCEIGSLILIWQLLKHFQLPQQRGLIYALNPLIIIEITGNLHYEGAMVFFLLLALWLLVRHKWIHSAFALGCCAEEWRDEHHE